jgi:hypothetical protein
MTRAAEIKAIVAKLAPWAASYQALRDQQDALSKLTGADCECALMAPVWWMVDDYTTALSELVGDEFGWLAWYAGENDLGRKGLTAVVNGREVRASTLRHIANVICATRDRRTVGAAA